LSLLYRDGGGLPARLDFGDAPRWAESFLVRRHEYLPLTFLRR
jgi:hypothetical protein